MHNCFSYIFDSNSLHVSSTQVLIIRRVLYQYDFWYMSFYAGDRVLCRFSAIKTSISHGHLHTVTYTTGRIDTIDSPED